MGNSGERRACSVGIDLGTTGIKVVAFNAGESGEQIALASRPSNLRRGADGAAELDPDGERTVLFDALAEAVEQAHKAGYAIARIGISAAMHSLLALDDQGAPITPVLTWADLRAESEARALWDSPQGPAIYERTGTPIHAMTPLAKLLWLRRAHPDIWQRATFFTDLKSWLWRQWFGEWVTDVSLASATALYNLRQRQWDEQALALAGVTPERLPRIVPAHWGHAGSLPAPFQQAGVDEGCAIVIGSSDGVLADLGVHVVDGSRLVVTIGTSLAVRVGASAIRVDPATRAFCYVLSEERSLYVLGQASNSGGSVLDWVYRGGVSAFASDAARSATHDTASGVSAAPEHSITFDEAMQAAGGADAAERAAGLYFLPYIAGERAPFWSANTSGALIGLRSEHTAVDALRAAAEGIMLNAAWTAEPFLTHPQPPQAIVVSGGAFQNNWMRQLAADVFGLPVYEVATIEASARGAAIMAELSTGARTWEQVSQPLQPTSVANPDSARHAAYRERGVTFRRFARQLNS